MSEANKLFPFVKEMANFSSHKRILKPFYANICFVLNIYFYKPCLKENTYQKLKTSLKKMEF